MSYIDFLTFLRNFFCFTRLVDSCSIQEKTVKKNDQVHVNVFGTMCSLNMIVFQVIKWQFVMFFWFVTVNIFFFLFIPFPWKEVCLLTFEFCSIFKKSVFYQQLYRQTAFVYWRHLCLFTPFYQYIFDNAQYEFLDSLYKPAR